MLKPLVCLILSINAATPDFLAPEARPWPKGLPPVGVDDAGNTVLPPPVSAEILRHLLWEQEMAQLGKKTLARQREFYEEELKRQKEQELSPWWVVGGVAGGVIIGIIGGVVVGVTTRR